MPIVNILVPLSTITRTGLTLEAPDWDGGTLQQFLFPLPRSCLFFQEGCNALAATLVAQFPPGTSG